MNESQSSGQLAQGATAAFQGKIWAENHSPPRLFNPCHRAQIEHLNAGVVERLPTASNLSRQEVERYKSCPLCSCQSPTAALTISEGKLRSSVSQSNCSLPALSGPGHLHQMTHLHTAFLSLAGLKSPRPYKGLSSYSHNLILMGNFMASKTCHACRTRSTCSTQ